MRRSLAVALALVAACEREPIVAPRASAARWQTSAVCAKHLGELAVELAPSAAANSAPNPELASRARAMADELSYSTGKLRALTLADAHELGDALVDPALALAKQIDLEVPVRLAAIALVGATQTLRASESLCELAEQDRSPAIRNAAIRELLASKDDHVLLRVILRLKYETDGETVISIARVLAHWSNFAGLEGLHVLASRVEGDEVRAHAETALAEIAAESNVASVEALDRAWRGEDVAAQEVELAPSPRLELEVWRAIDTLREWDLRRVDDARFELSRCASWVAADLAEALADEDVYVALHAAQCIERMGPRARKVCARLAAALDAPRIAPEVATALGELRCASAADDLRARLSDSTELELRTSAARALGRLGDPSALADLARLVASDAPLDLRRAAAAASLELGDESRAPRVLVECLTHEDADAADAERALESWLDSRAARSIDGAVELSKRWRELDPAVDRTPTVDEARERRRRRAELLRPSIESAR